MVIAGYRFNLDALLARIVYRWHWRVLLGLAAVVAGAGLATGHIPPFWRGTVSLVVQTAPGATITVDGRDWPFPVYAGDHRISSRLPDGRTSWADVTIASGHVLTMTLPAGLPQPHERVLSPAAPGMRLDRVWWADGAWRVLSLPEPVIGEQGEEPIASATLGHQTVAIGEAGAERLATIDAYAGLADQVHLSDALVEAVYLPDEQAGRGSAGLVEVRGWSSHTVAVTVSAPVTLVQFSPTGAALLLAEQAAAGEQVSLVGQDGGRVPVVAVPGQITRVAWHDDGRAFVLHSRQDARLTLTLVRLRPTIVTSVIADLDAARYAGDLVPLTWDDDSLLWAAPDAQGTPVLWRMPLAAVVAERVSALDIRALDRLSDGDLRVLAVSDGQLVVGRYCGQQFIGEIVVPRLLPADDLAGMWRSDELLVQSGDDAWLFAFGAAEESDR